MEYSYLTQCKLQILNEFLESPTQGLSYVNLPPNLPLFNTNTKIYYFQHTTRPSPNHLMMIYEHDDIKYYLELWCWSGRYWSLDSIKNELLAKKQNQGIFASIVDQAVKLYTENNVERSDYSYRNGVLIKDCGDIFKGPLVKRITPDYELGSFNEAEVRRFTGKSIEQIITFDVKYSDLDFEALLEEVIEDEEQEHYHCDLTTFDGAHITNFDYSQVHKFLYQEYQGSRRGWYGYKDYTFDNYLVILKKEDKYMFVHYCNDDASCAGFHFTLITKVYDSFQELWSKLNNQEKAAIIEPYL